MERTEQALPHTMNKRLPGGMYMAYEYWPAHRATLEHFMSIQTL
jgi:hypothetical protein